MNDALGGVAAVDQIETTGRQLAAPADTLEVTAITE
jgi:hypothetical protein